MIDYVWLCVDEDGEERMLPKSGSRPQRGINSITRLGSWQNRVNMLLPRGTISFLTGNQIGWDDEPIRWNPKKNQSSSDGWNFLPNLPRVNQEVLIAIKYQKEPLQAYWTGSVWRCSFAVREAMVDGLVNDARYKGIQERIYAWMELPRVPEF